MSNPSLADRFVLMAQPHLDAAYNLARWLTRNPDDADDVVQEAYLRAFRFFDGFRGGDGRAWLLSIVRNTCYTWMEKNRNSAPHLEYEDQTVSLELENLGGTPLVHQQNPELLLLRIADQRQIEAALRQLPLEFREILVLRELESLTYRQIGEIAGIPIGTVMSRLSRARQQLKQRLEVMERV